MDLIRREHDAAVSAARTAPSDASHQGLPLLSPAISQLVLGVPSLLDDPCVGAIIDSTVASAGHTRQCTGHPRQLTSGLIHLLSSESATRRSWAISVLPTASRQPLNFDEWCDLGIGVKILSLCAGETELKGEELWTTVHALLEGGTLGQETLEQGLLGGRTSKADGARRGRSLMAIIAPSLGTDAPGEFIPVPPLT